MDKKRTQRILGILVIIALVIILFPLLFSKNEVHTQTTQVTAPAFPDQQQTPTTVADASANEDTVNTTPITEPLPAQPHEDNAMETATEDSPTASEPESIPDLSTPLPVADSTNTSSMNQHENQNQPLELNDAVVQNLDASSKAQNQAENAAPSKNELVTPPSNEAATNQSMKKNATIKHSMQKTSRSKAHHKSTSHDMAKFNKQAWIVQMGSFKDKNNAVTLADKLRVSGYHAFTKEVKSSGKIRTRVFIGPEFKQANATKISQKIQRDMNLQSIVLPYKPLAL